MKYTIIVFKQDKRTKTGEKLVEKKDVIVKTRKQVDEMAAVLMKDPKIRVEIHQTMVKVKNLQTGKMVEQRYDTPRSCDVSSELYWAM